jgi:hypothetical protein
MEHDIARLPAGKLLGSYAWRKQKVYSGREGKHLSI